MKKLWPKAGNPTAFIAEHLYRYIKAYMIASRGPGTRKRRDTRRLKGVGMLTNQNVRAVGLGVGTWSVNSKLAENWDSITEPGVVVSRRG
jgi:hypothetical protein